MQCCRDGLNKGRVNGHGRLHSVRRASIPFSLTSICFIVFKTAISERLDVARLKSSRSSETY